MKKFVSLLITAGLAVSLAGCGGVLVDLNTPKAEELSAQYDYYSDSMNTIRGKMNITPEQADEVFIALVSCGVDDKITTVSGKDDLYTIRWGSSSLDVTMNDGIVSEISDGKDILYPEYQKANILLDRDIKTADVKSGSGDVIGQYAYVSVLKSQLKEVTEDNFKEFVETIVQKEEYKDFNYILIKCDDDTGILFSEKSAIIVSYGNINDDNMLEKTIGYITLNEDGSYTYKSAE